VIGHILWQKSALDDLPCQMGRHCSCVTVRRAPSPGILLPAGESLWSRASADPDAGREKRDAIAALINALPSI
jgi:hypothetical protein